MHNNERINNILRARKSALVFKFQAGGSFYDYHENWLKNESNAATFLNMFSTKGYLDALKNKTLTPELLQEIATVTGWTNPINDLANNAEQEVKKTQDAASNLIAEVLATAQNKAKLETIVGAPDILGQLKQATINTTKELRDGMTVEQPGPLDLGSSNVFATLYDKYQSGMKTAFGLLNLAKVDGILNAGNGILKAMGSDDDLSVESLKRDNIISGTAEMALNFGPYGKLASGVLKSLLLGDRFLAKAGIGKYNDTFSMDKATVAQVGSSYGDSVADLNAASDLSGKRHGFLGIGGRKALRRDNKKIAEARRQQSAMAGIAAESMDLQQAVGAMSDIRALSYTQDLAGGYDQRYMRAAKFGTKLEALETISLPDLLLTETLPDLFLVESLPELSIEKFKLGGLVTSETKEEPKPEETTQMNVIPEGALHKELHHMDETGMDTDELTKKGIPVVDNDGNLQAEIELNEIIFTLEVTNFIEERYKKYYDSDTKQSEKDDLAFEVGKELVFQILENTDDRTGLISSLKLGGTLGTNNIFELPELTLPEFSEGGTVNKKETPKSLFEEVIEEIAPEIKDIKTAVVVLELTVIEAMPDKQSLKDMLKDVLKEIFVDAFSTKKDKVNGKTNRESDSAE